jgi:hypothetical protein
MPIYTIPGHAQMPAPAYTLDQLKQANIVSCSGADGTSGYNTAINAILAVLDVYHQTA